jgi:TATA-box binding protein (TBP) (component of TFIID and TFIIIB)
MNFTVTNTNYRASLESNIDLVKLHLLIPNSKLHIKPRQLVVKDDKGVVIFFGNGKLRVMGCNDDLDATFLAYKYIELIAPYDSPVLHLQSMTVRAIFGHRLNLTQLQKLITPSQLELELFPALLIRKYKPISVNVFTTGKIIMCGIKNMNDIDHILKELDPLLNTVKA